MTTNTTWCKLLREDGKPVPRWIQRAGRWYEGLLTAKEEHDRLLGRHVLVARLASPGRDSEVVPPLIDARLVHMDSERMVFTGLSRDQLTRKDQAQAWLLMRGRQAPTGACSAQD